MSEDESIVPVTEKEVDDENPDSVKIIDRDQQSSDVEKKKSPRTARRRKRKKSKSRTVVVEELPSVSFVMGGERAKWLIPACFVAMILISVYGGMVSWNLQYADPDPSFDGTSREYHDCIMVNFKYGSRNSTDHDPYHPDNVECAEKQGLDPNWSELEYQQWLDDLLSGLTVVNDGNHSGYVWTEGGIGTMTYLVSTLNANMSVYYDPAAGDEFNATHLAIWNSATTDFGGGNDSFESLLPGGNTAMASYIGTGGIIGPKPTGYIWTAAGIQTMEILGGNLGSNMSVYGDPSPGDVFTGEHLAIWNAATVSFGGGNDTFEQLLPGGESAMLAFIGMNGFVEIAPTGFVWTEDGIATMEGLGASLGANMSVYGNPSDGDVFTQEHLGIWNGATIGFGGGNDSMSDLAPNGQSALAAFLLTPIVLWSNLSEMPTATNVTVTPSTPTTSDSLSCVYDYLDPQGDADASETRWYVNGMFAASNSSELSVASGDEITCSILPSDGVNFGFRIYSEAVIVS